MLSRLCPLASLCLRWLALLLLTALLAGTSAALFLLTLRLVGQWHAQAPWLLWGLPLAGLWMGWWYHRYAGAAALGNNLLLQQVHQPTQVIPLRMAPMILLTTLVSHLFGASVGREGTAMQMGASMADQVGHKLGFVQQQRPLIIIMGMSGGFAALFGTPIAGAIFAIEVLALGMLRWRALPLALLVAFAADWVCSAWGVVHDYFPAIELPTLGWHWWALLLLPLAFGLVGSLFSRLMLVLTRLWARLSIWPPFKPALAGLILALLAWQLPLSPYLGLGVERIQLAFVQPLPPWDWLAKLATTTWSLAGGFKGGEVTPLFFIGATLGNALAYVTALPLSFVVALGFVAVFAAASNTPLACSVMAAEIFGWHLLPFALLVCYGSYWVSGYVGIYSSQALGRGKYFGSPRSGTLADLANKKNTDK